MHEKFKLNIVNKKNVSRAMCKKKFKLCENKKFKLSKKKIKLCEKKFLSCMRKNVKLCEKKIKLCKNIIKVLQVKSFTIFHYPSLSFTIFHYPSLSFTIFHYLSLLFTIFHYPIAIRLLSFVLKISHCYPIDIHRYCA